MRHDTQQAPVFRSGSFFVVGILVRECGPQDLTQVVAQRHWPQAGTKRRSKGTNANNFAAHP